MEMNQITVTREIHEGEGPGGRFLFGDVARLSEELAEEYAGKVKVMYLDPPFMTGRRFSMRVRVGKEGWKGTGSGSLILPAFIDLDGREEYLALMRTAITAAHKMLRDDGMLFLHIDYRVHPYMRLLADEIFGEKNFLNEIIWVYQSGGRTKKCFSRKHDVILFYAKSKAYDFHIENVMQAPSEPPKNHMRRHVDPDGRVFRSIKSQGRVYTYYDDDPVAPSDVWTDVSHLQQKDPERTGYDTQKPLALLERIVACASREGELVCDLFAGSSTTLEAAKKLNRAYLGVDKSPLTLSIARRRLSGSPLVLENMEENTGAECSVTLRQGIGFYHFDLEHFVTPEGADFGPGLDVVDGWSAGYVEDGVYRVMEEAMRTRKNPDIARELRVPMYQGTPAVAVHDVAGRSYYYEFQ